MKKFMIAFAALAMVMSCTTEKLTQDIPAEEPAANGTVVTLTANLPALTKATVDDTAFSWSAGDQISLPSSKGEAIFTTTGDGTFTCTLGKGEVLVSGTAKYPATAPSNTFSSIEDAKKAFMMEAAYTVGDKSISFSHKSAIVKVSFTNVPSFATGLKVTEGENVVATIALSSPSEDVDFYVPITPKGSKKYTFALMENDNVVRSAAKTVDLIAGTYYTTPPIAVGRVLKFTCEDTSWSEQAIHVWEDGGSGVYDFKSTSADSSAEYPWKLNELSTGVFYAVLNPVTNLTWATDGVGIGVQFKHGDESTQTNCFYLYRDGDFTLPSAGGIKTGYRAYIRFSDDQWGYWTKDSNNLESVRFNGYWYSDGEQNKFADWVDCERISSSSKVFYYQFPEEYYGYGNIGFAFYNPVNTSWREGWGNAVVMNRDYLINK